MAETTRRRGYLERHRFMAEGARASLARPLDVVSLPAKRETPCHSFGLTPRELEVIRGLAAGCTNKRIADDLTISSETVKRHVANIFDKLGVSTRLEVALFAVHHQLIHRRGFDGDSPRLRNTSLRA
jgi:DNA-binding NarL/FixJ family response regulator